MCISLYTFNHYVIGIYIYDIANVLAHEIGMKLEINYFYDFGSKLLASNFQVHTVGKYAKAALLMGDYANIQFPIQFKHKYGHKIGDVLDTGRVGLYLISDKLKDVLTMNSLTGWMVFPVVVSKINGEMISGFHGLSITGRCGPIDYNKSAIIEKRLLPNGPVGKFYKGLHVGLDQWDGCDFFLPKDSFGPIVTARAARVIEMSKLSNIILINLADIELPIIGIPPEIEK